MGRGPPVVAWQVASRVLRAPAVVPLTARTSRVLERGMTGATENFDCGLREFEDMAFLIDLLRPGDLFMDIGANVGTYTVLAAGHCGARAVAVEPLPATFARLCRNVRRNDIGHLVRAHNCGVGEAAGAPGSPPAWTLSTTSPPRATRARFGSGCVASTTWPAASRRCA